MDDKFKDLPKIIKRLRVDNNLSQAELGEILECSQENVSDIENGKTYIGAGEWFAFCNYFGISVETFIIPNFLLADDEESNLWVMKEMLSEHKEFINIFTAKDGLELTRKIKADRHRNMPVILTTGNKWLGDIETIELGILKLLNLPFSKQDFLLYSRIPIH